MAAVPAPQGGCFFWRQPATLPLGWAAELRCPAVTSCGPGLGKARGASPGVTTHLLGVRLPFPVCCPAGTRTVALAQGPVGKTEGWELQSGGP